MTANDYDWWQRALAGEEVGGPTLPVHDGEWQSGFYRRRASKAGAFLPVALWRTEDGGFCLVNGKPSDPIEQWSYCCRHPISEDHYHARVNTGKWHDEDEAVTESLAPPPIGHNNGPTDPAEILQDQIDSALKGAPEYAEIKDDESAAKAQSLRSRLLELAGEAEKKHKVEKAPSLEEGRRIDKRWFPLRDMAQDAAKAIRAAMSAHETRKANAEAEARRLAQKALDDAERARKLAAIADAPMPEPVEPMPVAPPSAPVQTTIRGAYGKAASIRVVKKARVTDQDALYPALKTHKELIELMAQLAQRATNAGLSLPGVEVTEERDVR